MKNAGVTIEWILEKNFSKDFAMTQYGTLLGKFFPTRVLLDYLESRPDIKAFSSHGIREPLPVDPYCDFLPIIFIRHPIDRAFSVYHHLKNIDKNTPAPLQAKKLNLSEFIHWSLYKSDNTRLISNYQFDFLLDKRLRSEDEQIEFAIKRIKNCTFLGVVDRFDESVVVAEESLRKFYKNLDLGYIKQHVAENRQNSLSERIESEKKMVEKDIMSDLIKKNEIDFKLYSFANSELDKRIKKMDDFQKKLLNLKKRCYELIKQNKIIEGRTLLSYSFSEKKLEPFIEKT